MDDVHPIDDIDLDGKSRAKRIFVSLEPLPDKRIYRIDERGIETYEEEQPPEEKLKFLAQLIHEPERPEANDTHISIDKNTRLALDQLTRLKNIAAKLAQPESEFRLSQVDAPPPDPLEAENVTMAAYQGRQNQLKTSAELLHKTTSRLRDFVKNQRAYQEDFKTLRRSRWRLASPDQDRRPSVWNEHLSAIPKRFGNIWRLFDVFRTSDGNLTTLLLHHLSGLQLRVEAHDMLHGSSRPYYAAGIRCNVSDLFRPSSNCYVANNTTDIHRLWIWITKNHEESVFWTIVRKAALEEGMEMQEDEIVIPMPNSPIVYTLRALKYKYTVPEVNKPNKKSDKEEEIANTPSEARSSSKRGENDMDVDETTEREGNNRSQAGQERGEGEEKENVQQESPKGGSSASNSQSKKRKRIILEEARERCRNGPLMDDTMTEQNFSSERDLQPIFNVADSFSESDFDVLLAQDLVYLTLKQAVLIFQHGTHLDQTRFPLFPMRRPHAQQIQHTCFAPTIAVSHHFRQLLEVSRIFDEISYTVSRSCGLGPLEFHFEPTSLATLSCLKLAFGPLRKEYTINSGVFEVSPLQSLECVVEFVQHILQLIADFVVNSVARHVNALCGKDTAQILNTRCVSFPLGLKHPLSKMNYANQEDNGSFADAEMVIGDADVEGELIPRLHANFEMPLTTALGLKPSLIISPHVQGVDSAENVSWPLDTNIWDDLQGSNFAEKITSLILSTRV